MDPTYDLTVIRPPGTVSSSKVFSPILYMGDESISPTYTPGVENGEAIYVDTDVYDESIRVKNAYDEIPPRTFTSLRDKCNPYESLGSGRFINRAALKMANIDAVFRFLGYYTSLNPIVDNDKYKYAVLAEGPGGFVQYIQYRSISSRGYGITLSNPKEGQHLNWDVKNIDMNRFDIDYKGRVKGDVRTEWKAFTDYVLEVGGRMDLVTADGGIDVTTDYNRQEYLSLSLILAEVLIGIILTRETKMVDKNVYDGETHDSKLSTRKVSGGSFVFKVFDTVTRVSAQMMYVLTRCFEKVMFFKPVTSRPANSERYVICQGRLEDTVVAPWIELLKRALESDSVSFLKALPPLFEKWIVEENNHSLREQIETGKKIVALYKGASLDDVDVASIDLPLCFTLWNVPGWREERIEPCKIQDNTRSKSRRKNIPGRK